MTPQSSRNSGRRRCQKIRRFVVAIAVAATITRSVPAEKPSGGAASFAVKPIPPPVSPEKPAPPQINPNDVPHQQGPNFPGGQQTPDVKKPFENVVPGGLQPGAIPRDTGGDAIDTLRPDRETFGLDALNAAERRRSGGRSPDAFGVRRRDRDLDDAVEALRNVFGKGGSNRDPDRPGAGFRGAVKTDPQGLLNRAGSGLASEIVGTAQGTIGAIKTVDHPDGSRTTTEHHDRGDGVIQDITTHQDSDGTIKTQTIVERARDGSVVIRTAERQTDGMYWNTTQTRNRDGSGRQSDAWRGPAPHVNVDPDSPYGQRGGAVVGLGQQPKDPKMVEAREGVGPGARPDENANTAVKPRLNVNVDLTGQPNPGEHVGGSGPGHRGYNPDDFVRPPRPNDP